MANGYTKTVVGQFLEVHREQHHIEAAIQLRCGFNTTTNGTKQKSGLTPIRPAVKEKFQPCRAAGIFPIKPKKAGLSRSLLPIPVVTVSSGSADKKNKTTTSTNRRGKSRIPVLANTIHLPKLEALKKKERDLTIELLKTRADIERVEHLHKSLFVTKNTTPIRMCKRRSKSLALDSPFNENESPNLGNMSPMLLSISRSRDPACIYQNYRRNFSFLQTPTRSFFKPCTKPASDVSPSSSRNVQSQLARLFA